jgi:hypothetical protein
MGAALAKSGAWLSAPFRAYAEWRRERIIRKAQAITGGATGLWIASWQPLSLVALKAGIIAWASLALHAYALDPLAQGIGAAYASLGLERILSLSAPTPKLARDISWWALAAALGLNGAWLGARLARAAFVSVAVDSQGGMLVLMHGTPLKRRSTVLRSGAEIASSLARNPAQALLGLGDLEFRMPSGETLRVRSIRKAGALLAAFARPEGGTRRKLAPHEGHH